MAGEASASSPDRKIVGLTPDASFGVARQRAASVRRELDFEHVGKAVAGEFPDEALNGLRNHPRVEYVEDDGTYHALAQTLPWGVDRVGADVVHADGETGGDDTDGEGGADVAVLDTGTDSDHPDLDANLGSGTAFVDCGSTGGCRFGAGPNDNTCHYAWDDDDNHGTHCAGIADAEDDTEGVVGVSTAATLHAVKVLDGCGGGSLSDVAAGIEYVADRGWDVASMSLGASSGDATLKNACQYAHDEGVLLVAAAGNDGPCTDCVGYPAAYPEVIAVSATTKNDDPSGFSSTGPEVEIAAPGKDIHSTVPGGYDTYSGTSMAGPHVSGAGGQLMDNGYTNTEARSRLESTAEDVGLASNESGSGLLDVEAALSSSGGSDSAPSVSWVAPVDGDTVSGTVTVRIDASDSEDSNDSLTVEYTVDGGSARGHLRLHVGLLRGRLGHDGGQRRRPHADRQRDGLRRQHEHVEHHGHHGQLDEFRHRSGHRLVRARHPHHRTVERRHRRLGRLRRGRRPLVGHHGAARRGERPRQHVVGRLRLRRQRHPRTALAGHRQRRPADGHRRGGQHRHVDEDVLIPAFR